MIISSIVGFPGYWFDDIHFIFPDFQWFDLFRVVMKIWGTQVMGYPMRDKRTPHGFMETSFSAPKYAKMLHLKLVDSQTTWPNMAKLGGGLRF